MIDRYFALFLKGFEDFPFNPKLSLMVPLRDERERRENEEWLMQEKRQLDKIEFITWKSEHMHTARFAI